MQSLLEDPAVQAALAPLVVALLIGSALHRTRLAWLAIAAALATAVALSTGIAFSPLTAARKILLLVFVAPLIGIALDARPTLPRLTLPALAALSGAASVWVFWSVLSQRELPAMLALGGGVAAFTAAMVALALRLRSDGAAGGAATVALGVAVGLAALLSASIGNFANGIAIAAGGGALMLLQFALARATAPGFVGMLTTGLAAALIAAATFILAELPWYALPLLLLVPAAAALPLGAGRSGRVRLVYAQAVALAAAAAPLLAAWLATRAVAA